MSESAATMVRRLIRARRPRPVATMEIAPKLFEALRDEWELSNVCMFITVPLTEDGMFYTVVVTPGWS